jgi:hypothetical protein
VGRSVRSYRWTTRGTHTRECFSRLFGRLIYSALFSLSFLSLNQVPTQRGGRQSI